MDQRQRTKRFGLCVILFALVFRLAAEGIPRKMLAWLIQLDTAPIHTYSETGRNVRFSASEAVFWDHVRESPPPWLPEAQRPRFSAEDAELVEVSYACSKQPDLQQLLESPLEWDLAGETPTVLILHTHTTESYTPGEEPYIASSAYRTLEEDHNMLRIGDAVAEILEEKGIGVIHDRTLHDYPSYNGSYVHARQTISGYLAENPSIQLVLDLHRDASGTASHQLRTEAMVEGSTSAQLMLVMGTNYDTWEENLALALKLHVQLERQCPGIMRPLSLRGQRFNQDLCRGALLVEVGAAGNTRQEALTAARALAEGIAELAKGADTGNRQG